MKKTRILSGVCASAMMLSMAASAFAADTATDKTLAIKGTTNLPTINVVMPTAPAIILNPYKLKVVIDKTTTIDGQIDSPTMFVQNLSNVPLKVELDAYATAGGGVEATLGTASVAAVEDKKQAYVVLMTKVQDDATTAITAPDPLETTTPTDGSVGVAILKAKDDTSKNAVDKLDPDSAAAEGINKLAASTDGKKAAAKGVLALRFGGDVSTEGATWDAKDKIDATLTFKFVPQMVDAAQ